MTLIYILRNSLPIPRKETTFSLNRVSMINTLLYLFLLILISVIPNILNLFLAGGFVAEQNTGVFLIQIIILYPLIIIFTGIVGISILAAGGMLVNQVMGRRLNYNHIWKMTVYAATVPLLLYTCISFLDINSLWIDFLLLLLLFFYLYKMIVVYPAIPRR